MIDLAVNSRQTCVQLSDIAHRNSISIKYLEQIFTALRKAGIIRSIKGPQGGYLLACRPEEIRIANVIETLDGSYLLDAEETNADGKGEAAAAAVQNVMIEPMNTLVYRFLNELTLQDFVESFEEYNRSQQHMYYI